MTLLEIDALWPQLKSRWSAAYAHFDRDALVSELADLTGRRQHYCANCVLEREVRIECLNEALGGK